MDNLIDAVNEALKRLEYFRKGILSISSVYNKMAEVHVDSANFFKHFDNYKLTYRNCDTYPIEAYEIVNGTKFFSIYSVEDFHDVN